MDDRFDGYYTFPFSGEPYEGDVIQLHKEQMRVLYQTYAFNGEDRFRDKLDRYDKWLFDKPHKVQERWLNYITKWLTEEREKYTEKEQHNETRK